MTILEELVESDFGIEGRGRWKHASEHDSLVVDVENQRFFWNSTGLKGSAIDYLVHVRGMEKSEARNFLNNYFGAFKENSESSPQAQPYDKLVEIMWANGINHREYWYKRCLKDETIDRAKLGYYDGWNLVPIYKDSEFINFQMRRDEPKKAITQWYRTGKAMPLYNEGILPFLNKVYITEGTVDSILLQQEGFPCISPNGTNTWQPEWFSKFSKIKEIIYIADMDKPGLNGARLVANSLGIYRTKIVLFECMKEKYDSVNFFQDGGTKDSFMDWIREHSYFLFEIENIYGRTKDLGKLRKEFAWAK